MTPHSLTDLAEALRRHRLLEPAQLEEVAGELAARFPEPRALARELVQRGWLTPYQVNQLFLGRGQDLLLGSYVLLERLGEGGMGAVFKARNWKLGQAVALKLVRKERLAGADAVRRFQREIRAAAALEHPNIVRAHDADEVDGTHFLVMEYVEGTDLSRQVKKRGPLPVAEACAYVRQAALGLQHAHERGLVHRDVKPSNLLLTRAGVVKVLDLGLARLSEGTEEGELSTTMTQEGLVVGTPDYMAPEQTLDAHLVDIRADLYSLGCTLYYLLTGQVPFPGGSVGAKIARHQVREPTPVEELRPEVPPEVGAVVRRLMAKKPEDRFQTPAELAEALAGPAGSAGGAATPTGPEAAAPAAADASTVDPQGAESDSALADDPSDLPGATMVLREAVRAWRKGAGTGARRAWLVAGGVAGTLALIGLVLALTRPWQRAEAPRPDPAAESGPGPAPVRVVAPAAAPVDDAWIDAVAALPAAEQVEEVSAKLKGRNPGFDGTLKSVVEKGVVTRLELVTDRVSDLDPLRGLPGLKHLRCRGSAPGKGQVTDLAPVQSMRLASLDCGGNLLAHLLALKGMPLTALACDNTGVRDLAPLAGMPLAALDCSGTAVGDLAPLRGMRLTSLHIRDTNVTDLSPLAGMPLAELDWADSPVEVLAPLRGLPLRRVACPAKTWGELHVLRSLESLETVNGKPAAAFWKEADAERARFEAWAAAVARLPADKQAAAVGVRLKELNPGFDGNVTPTIDKGAVTGLRFSSDAVTDLSPVRALRSLKELSCRGSGAGKSRLSDLSPLRGLRLSVLDCPLTRVADLAPLRGMPLTTLNVHRTRVADLAQLKGMELKSLDCTGTAVTDLAPLRGMPLTALYFSATKVADLAPLGGMNLRELNGTSTKVSNLAPLRGMPLVSLGCAGTGVSDLSPLKGMPLQQLSCDFNAWRDADVLRPLLRTLQTVNGTSAESFWKPHRQFAAWCKQVGGLPAAEQVKAVAAELKKRNPKFDGVVKPATAGGVVTGLEFVTDQVTDLSPVRALPGLKLLRCRGSGWDKGKLADLWPLHGLPLHRLDCGGNRVRDLSPLRGMRLNHLSVDGNPVADLSLVRDMPLTYLNCNRATGPDLSFLRGLRLTTLECWGKSVTDLAPLLRGMPLERLACNFNPWRDAELLRSFPALKAINRKPAAAFWQEVNGARAALNAWAASVARMPAAEQVKAVAAKLKERNPKFDGKLTPTITNDGVVTDLAFLSDGVTDLSPLQALPGLKELRCSGSANRSKLDDLWPLRGLRLTTLECAYTQVSDLSPLRGMPLTDLSCGWTGVKDLAPLEGLRLRRLACSSTGVADLAPLRGMPLTELVCAYTPVKDLTPLQGMRLTYLNCDATRVADLTPLRGMPLTALHCYGTEVADLSPLEGMPLVELVCHLTKVADLAPLKGMRLKMLYCHRSGVAELAPLKGMPLTELWCGTSHVADLTPLAGMPLVTLHCEGTWVADLSPLKGLPLATVTCDFLRARDAPVLRAIPTLQNLNGQPAAALLKVAGPPAVRR